MTYTCSTCGKQNDDWPAIAFDTPSLSDEDKEKAAELNSDFCVIEHEDQTDRYIRAVLFQKVIDHCEDLHYGVWVSLSEKSFNDYKENFHNEAYKAVYFGYLCNWIPGYDSTFSLHTNVQVSKGNSRPEVIRHEVTIPLCRIIATSLSRKQKDRLNCPFAITQKVLNQVTASIHKNKWFSLHRILYL